MSQSFRDHHIEQILTEFDPNRGPLDRFLHLYFKHNRALGSNDRREISERIYHQMRWLELSEHLEIAIEDIDLDQATQDESIPAHCRVSCPEELFGLLVEAYGEERATVIALANNKAAPTTIRTNTLKISREELLEKFPGAVPTKLSADGITFPQRLPLFSTEEFHAGYFEMQDEGSQLLAQLVEASPGDHVLDYCAGAGGKSLAIAPRLQGKGQLYLHDIREKALLEAKQRLKRAGVQNVQIMRKNDKKLKKKMDWVLVDAPCTGTGTYRRNPDMKWRFTAEHMQELVGLQRTIFERALSFLKPGGRIVYATCSVLPQENQQQVEHFCKTYGLEVIGDPLSIFPADGGPDGFFGSVLKQSVL